MRAEGSATLSDSTDLLDSNNLSESATAIEHRGVFLDSD